MENQENNQKNITRMSAEDVADFLSQTMRDVAERKVTLRYALVVSRLAIALSKAIETADLKDRLEFLEQVLAKRKTK